MKLLVDTNIVLDVVLERGESAMEAAQLLSVIEEGKADGYVAGHSVTTVYYVVSRTKDEGTARQAVSDLLDILEVIPPNDATFRRALTLPMRDYEDAVQAACALKIGADYIVTRNVKDFEEVEISSEPAGAVLAQL